MFKIGCHLSIAKGYTNIGKNALQIGANTFQFFIRNPRGAKAKEINEKDIKGLQDIIKKNQFATILAHAPYTMNIASKEERVKALGKQMMVEDIQRLDTYFPGNMYNFHPGSHGGEGISYGINNIIQILNEIIRPDQKTTVLIETMSGKGSEIGGNFEELRIILDEIQYKNKIGVCMDICHVNDAGYDVKDHLDEVLEKFDHVIGIKNLKAIHLNDSKNEIGAHKDRHAPIGEGTMGLKTAVNIINHPQLCQLPFYLETPLENEGHAKEIQVLKQSYKY